MTDTAIPVLDPTQPRLADLVREFKKAARAFGESTVPALENARRSFEAVGRAMREHQAASAQHHRVRSLMPTLTMRQVLVHGYVATEEA